MDPIKHILYPTDFSPDAQHALPFAIELVKKSGARFSLLHVYSLPWNAHEKAEESIVTVREKVRTEQLERLKTIVSRYGLDDHPHRCYVREGGAPEHILDVIDQDGVDLVVMGTQGATAERSLLMGSVTKEVLEQSASPVLAIPHSARLHPFSTIVYATDLQFDESNLVNYVVQLARLFEAQIHVLHVAFSEGNREWDINALQKLIRSTAYPRITYRNLVMDDVEEGIEQYLREIGANMLTMTTYSTTLFARLFRKSLTKEMLLQTEVPLLAFNRKKYNKVFV